MYKATALVTVPNLTTDRCGATRKRGMTVVELSVTSEYSHVSLKQLRLIVEAAIKAYGGNLAVACRQVDIYIRGEHVASFQPYRNAQDVLQSRLTDSMIDCDMEYADSLRDAIDAIPSPLNRKCPKCCRPIDGKIFHGDACLDAIAEQSPFDRVESLQGDDPIRDMLRDFRPVATIFGQADIGDRCADAISGLGK